MKQLSLHDLWAKPNPSPAQQQAPAISRVHVFRESLKQGENARTHAFWDKAYAIHFPTMQQIKRFTDMRDQYNGRDTRITVSGGEILHIQEKTRLPPRTDTDIALEFEHRGPGYNDVGWIEKDQQIHYLAYGFITQQRVYFFPWHQLRKAWIEHGTAWKETHLIIGAKNKGDERGPYTSYSVCVPTIELRRAIAQTAIVDVPQ